MKDLRKLGNPIEFWDYFYEISQIPRCSQKEEKIRDYVKNEAKNFNYDTRIDDIGNIVIKVPSKQDISKTILNQSSKMLVSSILLYYSEYHLSSVLEVKFDGSSPN